MTVTLVNRREAVPEARPPFGVARLLDPVDVTVFASDYWERQPLVVPRDDPDYYAELLTVDALDNLLTTSSLRSGQLQIVADGKDIPLQQLTNESGGTALLLEAVFDRYRNGATLVFPFLSERWPPLAALSRTVGTELGGRCQVNVYLTPAGSQGFSPHYDAHDVFVAQISGTKHWRLYDSPTRLPLENQPYQSSPAGPGDPLQEFDLRPGDLMYLPRGTVHDATANDEASVHLTIGIRPVLWETVLRDAITAVVRADPDLRAALPLGFADNGTARAEAVARATDLVGRLTAALAPDDLVSRATEKVVASRPVALRGHLVDLSAAQAVDLGTSLRPRPGVQWQIQLDPGTVTLEFHGKRVSLPATVTSEIRYIVAAERFTPADIPGDLDDEGRLVLVRSLLHEGFLTIAT